MSAEKTIFLLFTDFINYLFSSHKKTFVATSKTPRVINYFGVACSARSPFLVIAIPSKAIWLKDFLRIHSKSTTTHEWCCYQTLRLKLYSIEQYCEDVSVGWNNAIVNLPFGHLTDIHLQRHIFLLTESK